MSEINETLTFEVLRKLQQQLKHIEQRIDGFEAELGAVRRREIELQAVRSCQLAMLKDLRNLYGLVARHHIQLGLFRASARREDASLG
ncbi:hypothetical protein [Bradyrhizobium sp. STM 3557]|uniref:hypothetical protein n=1 Tax=Bradyrhizobium sp. STM 3557 TaxID=578920 RepID=UPI00388FCDBA